MHADDVAFIEALAKVLRKNDRAYREQGLQDVPVSISAVTGDTMVQIHKGMNISEVEFNASVELLQQAMDEASIPLSAQNRLLAELAPMRSDMLYK